MANQWFRFYSEFASDPKVQILSEALQRRYVMLLCLHNADHYIDAQDDELAFALNITVEDWQETKAKLINRGLLNEDGSIHGWENRQTISDLKDPGAAARQKRYREKRKENRESNVTRNVTPCNVTPLEENRIEENRIEENRIDKKDTRATRAASASRFDDFWKAWPNKVGKPSAEKSYAKVSNEHDAIMAGVERYLSNKPPDRPWLNPATFLNQRRWEDSPASVDARAPTDGKADWSSKMLREIERRLDSEQPTEQSTALNAPLELLSIDGKSWA